MTSDNPAKNQPGWIADNNHYTRNRNYHPKHGQKAECFIDEIVENLTIQYLLKNKLDSNRKEITKIVSSFFLLPNNDTTIKISDKVLSKLVAHHA